MDVFRRAEEYGMEEVIFCRDRRTGLKAIIGIHDTTLGPAMGGTRMYPYASEEEALEDLFRLAQAMTYKASAAGLDLGGGKAVIIGDPEKEKNEALLRTYGRFVERQNGRYITSVDMGINSRDIDQVRRETSYALGGSARGGRGGDPSPATAYGVWQGMKVCAEEVFGSPSLSGLTIAVQGLGSVGFPLCRHLYEEGAKLVVADLVEERIEKAVRVFGAQRVDPHLIHAVECHIFAPCASGGILNEKTLPELKCSVIAGAANNMLVDDKIGEELHKRGILYAPDYVINAGGLIFIAHEYSPYTREEIFAAVARIGERLKEIFRRSRLQDIPPFQAANLMALERIEEGRKVLSLRNFREGNFYV